MAFTAAITYLYVYPWSDLDTRETPRSLFALYGLAASSLVLSVVRGSSAMNADPPGSVTLRAAAVLVCLGPLAAASLAYSKRTDHRHQDAMFATFAEYTHRFPPDRLSDPWVYVRSGEVGTICAAEHAPGQDANYLCLSLDLRRPEPRRVDGGYRAAVPVGVDYSGPGTPYDCFGRALREGECSE